MGNADLTRIARQLMALALDEDEGETAPPGFQAPDLAQVAHLIYHNRREREALLGTDLFADPGWDILLDLYIQEARGKSVNVSSACLAACAPSTTGLRWLAVLEARGLIKTHSDVKDKRVRYLSLTAHGNSVMTRYLQRTLRSFALRLPAVAR
jgi:hypothetical protein